MLIVALKDEPQPIQPEPAPVTVEAPQGPRKRAKQEAAQRVAPAPSPAATPQSPARVGQAAEGGVSREDLDTLLRNRNRDARRSAAKRVLKNPAGAPHYMMLVAELEAANSCGDKKDVLEEMRTLADPRVLPALERLAEQPRRGCGLIRLTDCLGCLRRELDQAIGALQHGR
jgi:hypothetical protein